MTQIVPVTAGLTGYAAMTAAGHPVAAPFVGVACLGAGYLGKYAGNGVHLRRGQMRKVEFFMHRAIAANWGVRPLADRFDQAEQQKLLGCMFDAVAGDPIQQLVEQWPIIWAHVQRVHLSGIPPLASLRAMRRAYRPSLFGKDRDRARELAQPVVDAYATLHPEPEADRDWYLRWTAAVGLREEAAHQIWTETMRRRPAGGASEADVADLAEARQEAVERSERRRGHLSEDEIERRLAATRG